MPAYLRPASQSEALAALAPCAHAPGRHRRHPPPAARQCGARGRHRHRHGHAAKNCDLIVFGKNYDKVNKKKPAYL